MNIKELFSCIVTMASAGATIGAVAYVGKRVLTPIINKVGEEISNEMTKSAAAMADEVVTEVRKNLENELEGVVK